MSTPDNDPSTTHDPSVRRVNVNLRTPPTDGHRRPWLTTLIDPTTRTILQAAISSPGDRVMFDHILLDVFVLGDGDDGGV